MSSEKAIKSISLGNAIRYERKSKGFSIKELALKSNITKEYLGQIELDRTIPSTNTLRAIAIGLNLPAGHFLQSDTEPKTAMRRRLTFELYLPDDLNLTEEEVVLIRKRIEKSGHDILNMIKDLRKEK